MNTKKAAMFGLDARIALAIFGALSVISGAALYSAIQEAKVTSIITDMNELGKAVDAYQLDVGSLPVFDVITAPHYMNLYSLVNDTVQGWKGPYINLEQYGEIGKDALNLSYKEYNYIGVRRLETSIWGDGLGVNFCDDTSAECGLYIVLAWLPKAIADEIDKRMDGSLDATVGKVRQTKGADDTWAIFMQYRPYTYK